MNIDISKAPSPKQVFPNSENIIVPAFEIEGTWYYEFEDFNNVPCDRGFHALSYYNELDMRCTREFLLAHCKKVDEIINDNSKGIKITDIALINNQLKERLEFLFEPDIAYKLCSVVYFDATENPYTFEYKHAMLKAEIFKKKVELKAFFLSQPIKKLVPFTPSSIQDLQAYSEIVQKITKKQQENISMMPSEIVKMVDLNSTETLRKIRGSA